MANANGNASGSTSGITTGNVSNNGAGTPAGQPPEPPLSRSAVTSAMEAALGPGMEQGDHDNVTPLAPGAAHRPVRNVPTRSPAHVHGSALEGGDSPAVLAQPASASSEGQGSRFHPDPASTSGRAKRVIAGAQDVAVARYRRVTEGTDDFVHDNPWKAITLAGIGGLIVGLLISR
ncbi:MULTISPECIES: YqjD family protein [unclassified Caballeronia]|uniref:DUF883 family protein n=1 Tax=unclassified Caballeronia TaxID=2646786 RepID=UPI0028593853|nr:DUF883 domain-containing protein [Caballeronia sp. LZ016]MDR5811795.1 DUF883 domain-containing protein [Caballeronia sp. LZ019]